MCPDNLDQPERLIAWESFRGTPDYFNSCDESQYVGVPLNQTNGYQEARSGDGYGGFIGINYNSNREILGVELIEPLSVDQEYYVEFYVSRTFGGLAHSNCDCATSHLGALFSTEPYDNIENPMMATNTAHVYTTDLVVDTVNWVQISGWFTADSAYSHLAIGNTFDLDSCEIEFYNGSPKEIFLNTYYYLEDVCVATDPAICDSWNNLNEQRDDAFSIYQANSNSLKVTGITDPFHYRIFDSSGRLLQSDYEYISGAIDISSLNDGIYLLAIRTGQGNWTKRFIKQ